MSAIYSKATEVVAWLGHEHHLLKDFIFAITEFRAAMEQKYGNHTPNTFSILTDQLFWRSLNFPHPSTYYALCRAAAFCGVCRWFNRSWVVQEAVLGSQVRILGGSTWVSWDDILWLGRTFETSWRQIMGASGMPKWLRFRPPPGYRICEFQHQRNTLDKYLCTVPPTSGITRFLRLFLNLIQIFRGTECSDDRDKIYSLLGLAHRSFNRDNEVPKDLIPVDYEKNDTVAIYSHFAHLCIEHVEHLHLLSFKEDRIFVGTQSLPSWVPDFTMDAGALPLPDLAPDPQRPFRVWGQHHLDVHKPQFDGSELTLWGTKVDTVERYVYIQAEDYKDLGCLRWLQLCLPDVRRQPRTASRIATTMWTMLMRSPESLREQTTYSVEDLTNAFRLYHLLRIAWELWVSVAQANEAEDKQHAILQTWLDQLQPEIEAGEVPTLSAILECRDWLVTANDAAAPESEKQVATKGLSLISDSQPGLWHFLDQTMRSRTLFRTASGVLGVGPLSMEQDDDIWMLDGGDVPVIVRPYYRGRDYNWGDVPFALRRYQDGHEYRCELVGECYLSGIMYGEKLEEDPKLREKMEPIIIT